jgi:7-keto-8-aminopelargonate synthetase-like enzyme
VIEPEPLQQIDRTYVRFFGRKLSYFSGCDYFRLSTHPAVLASLADALKRYGLNVAASRLTTGNHRVYAELEAELARFFDAPDALLVASGYLANLVVAQTLAGNFSHALMDEKSHPSVKDSAYFLECPVLQFRHRDPSDLDRAVKRCGPGSKMILLTDGMFSQDGSIAPLKEYLQILPKDALIMVDDAHGAGVLGRCGQGSIEEAGLNRRRFVQTITLSKAFGVYGGAILGSTDLRNKALSRSRLLIGSTPMPLPVAGAACQAVRTLRSKPSYRRRLFANAEYVRSRLVACAFPWSKALGPIVAVHPRHEEEASRLKAALLSARIYPPLVKYPGGPSEGYFRFVISSEHTRRQLDTLVKVLSC